MTFMDLENPAHAYLFGFLQADGHLFRGHGQKGRLAVELNARDIDLLERFKALCPYPSSITTRTRVTNFAPESRTAVWSVCALAFRRELVSLGLPEGRKSHLILPPAVAFSQRDYLRGVIDADGSAGMTAQGLPFVSLTTASDAMAEFFCAFAERTTGAARTLRRNKRDRIYNVLYTREPAVQLAATLYWPGCLALERKRRAAEALQRWTRPPGMRRNPHAQRWTPEQDRILIGAPSVDAAAEQLGRSRQSCAMRKWRLVGPARSRVRFNP